MRDREPTMRSRELGGKLRRAMVRAGLDGRQAAHLLGWSEGKVSRLLSGKRGGGELDVAAFLAVCRVKGPGAGAAAGAVPGAGHPGLAADAQARARGWRAVVPVIALVASVSRTSSGAASRRACNVISLCDDTQCDNAASRDG